MLGADEARESKVLDGRMLGGLGMGARRTVKVVDPLHLHSEDSRRKEDINFNPGDK